MFKKLTAVLLMLLLLYTATTTFSYSQNLQKLKKRIAVFEFEDKTDHRIHWWTGQSVGRGMADMLITALVNSGKYKVIERTAMEHILKEQGLGQSGVVTSQSAAEVGKMLGVEIAVLGSVTEFGHSRGGTGGRVKGIRVGVSKQAAVVAVDVRLINTSTGEIIASKNARKEEKKGGLSFGTPKFAFNNKNKFDESLVGKAARKAIEEVVEAINAQHDNIPWQAKVVKATGSTVIINVGAETGIENGMEFVVYSQGEELIDPDTGLSLGTEEEKVGRIKVSNNNIGNGKASKCQILEGSDFDTGYFVRLK